MTFPQRPDDEPEQQWTQPPFAPGPASQPSFPQRPSSQPAQSPTQSYPYDPSQSYAGWNTTGEVNGGVLVPQPVQPPYPARLRVPPATPVEAILRTVASVLFPAMIALAIFGQVSWVGAVVIALVVPGILNRLAREMKQRRIASAQYQAQPGHPAPPGPENDLR